MSANPEDQAAAKPPRDNVSIKVFGAGGAGLSVMEQMIGTGFPGVEFIAVSTDDKSLAASTAPEKIKLETKLLRGLGTGGDPERAREAAEEAQPRLSALCAGSDVIFILAGLGGGAGTGIGPVLARVAKEAGALVLGFVTLPFDCEGRRRQALAQQGLSALKAAADGVICLPNQKVFKLINENTSVIETFKITNTLLAGGAQGVWRLLAHSGLIEIHFADFCALLRDRHAESSFGVAEASGAARAREVLDKLLAHPLLEGGEVLLESEAVLVSVMGGPDLTMTEVHRVMEEIQGRCGHAQVIMGAAIDPAFNDRLAVTLISAGKSCEPADGHGPGSSGQRDEFDTQLLPGSDTSRTGSRFVPPPPALPQEKLEQLFTKQRAGAPKKSVTKLRQTQLPLEIISKGRFDKSEPTIHKGEDLDVPTYIRRGVALN